MCVNVFEVIWYAGMLLILLTLNETKQKVRDQGHKHHLGQGWVKKGSGRSPSGSIDQEEGALMVRQKGKQDRK